MRLDHRLSSSNNHNHLIAPFLTLTHQIPREFTQSGPPDLEALAVRGKALWTHIERQIRARKPRLVILSGEYFFAQSEALLTGLRDLLADVFTDIEVAAYLRHPASYYLSLAQQKIKASYAISAPSKYHLELEPCLTRHLAVFDGRVRVRAFDRRILDGGCIVRDFLRTFVPGGDELANEIVVANVNESMSAEAMCIMQRLRRHGWPDENDVFAQESNRVMRILNASNTQLPQTQARLKPGISAAISRTHQDQLDWLQDRFGLEFQEHSSDVAEPEVEPQGWTSRELIDILAVDDIQVERVLYGLLKELSSSLGASDRASRS